MKVFTIDTGKVTEGATVGVYSPTGDWKISTITVGEQGRGRALGSIVVEGITHPQVPCPNQGWGATVPRNYKEHKMNIVEPCLLCGTMKDYHEIQGTPDPDNYWFGHDRVGTVEGPTTIINATMGLTRSGKPKLVNSSSSSDSDSCIVVDLTGIGFRGGNQRTGDWVGFRCSRNYGDCSYLTSEQNALDQQGNPLRCTKYPGVEGCEGCSDQKSTYLPFPGKVLASGTIAQGDAGRMGDGTQEIYTMPKGIVWRVARSGRLYGESAALYYRFDGEKIQVATWKNRELFPDEHPFALK